MPPDPRDGRRRFLEKVTLGVGALTTAGIVAGPAGMALHPLLGDGEAAPETGPPFLPVGSVDRFAVGAAPARVVLKEDSRDAWLSRRGVPVGSVLVQRTDAVTFRVFSGVCPHLGCAVGYRPDADSFLCPCHQSSFQLDGALRHKPDGSSNPAPRPLDSLEWRVRAGRLEVAWVRYKTGTSEKTAIG